MHRNDPLGWPHSLWRGVWWEAWLQHHWTVPFLHGQVCYTASCRDIWWFPWKPNTGDQSTSLRVWQWCVGETLPERISPTRCAEKDKEWCKLLVLPFSACFSTFQHSNFGRVQWSLHHAACPHSKAGSDVILLPSHCSMRNLKWTSSLKRTVTHAGSS